MNENTNIEDELSTEDMIIGYILHYISMLWFVSIVLLIPVCFCIAFLWMSWYVAAILILLWWLLPKVESNKFEMWLWRKQYLNKK